MISFKEFILAVISIVGIMKYFTVIITCIRASTQNDVQIRWHYYNARNEWYWGIDDVKITANETLVPLAGDFEFDCFVNLTDFSLFANVWMSEPNDISWNRLYDISEPSDNIIDAFDLESLANNWLMQWP